MSLAERWREVEQRAAEAARRSRRDATAVRIVAVSKTKPVEDVMAAIAAGAVDLGENYVQEAAPKIAAVAAMSTAGKRVHWHMIGHLQRNKAAKAAALFDVIHSVDSVELGLALANQAAGSGKQLRILIEVNLGRETSKNGVAATAVEGLLAGLVAAPNLLIDGLMTIPPAAAQPEASRPHFAALRQLRDRLQASAPPNAPLKELSMGMTDDFEVAIEEGATMVRVGRAIFGEREPRN
jgi:PLP dependent protein